MADAEYATSTIDHVWCYLNQACVYGLRLRMIKTNPVVEVLLPTRPPKERKSFMIEQAEVLLRVAISADRRPALWITGLMCGPRPGELAGVRWPYVDVDSDEPFIAWEERVDEVEHRYVGQATPKTKRKGAIGCTRWWSGRCNGIAAR
jgi:integrase